MRLVLKSNFELAGNGVLRLAALAILGKVLPLGNLRGGPGARCLLVLIVLHHAGALGYRFALADSRMVALVRRSVDALRRRLSS